MADMEAGLEHLSIGTLEHLDILLLVIEPTAKVLMTADRAHKLALELGIQQVAYVGNRIRRPGDAEQLEAFARAHAGELLIAIPEDGSVRRADMRSACILDVSPEAPLVAEIARLAETLENRFLLAVPAGG
ncbi:MAG: hypothetical protein ABR540_00310 [Acidimicrobiales bacterium]|nr:hypothetical protein [Actinomycetota bacterium]